MAVGPSDVGGIQSPRQAGVKTSAVAGCPGGEFPDVDRLTWAQEVVWRLSRVVKSKLEPPPSYAMD